MSLMLRLPIKLEVHWQNELHHSPSCHLRELNTLRPRHFAADIFKCIFLNEKYFILIQISLKSVVPRAPISMISNGSDNGLASIRQQAIIWTKDGTRQRRILPVVYAALRLSELTDGRYGSDDFEKLKVFSLNTCYQFSSWAVCIKLLSGECHWTPVVFSDIHLTAILHKQLMNLIGNMCLEKFDELKLFKQCILKSFKFYWWVGEKVILSKQGKFIGFKYWDNRACSLLAASTRRVRFYYWTCIWLNVWNSKW